MASQRCNFGACDVRGDDRYIVGSDADSVTRSDRQVRVARLRSSGQAVVGVDRRYVGAARLLPRRRAERIGRQDVPCGGAGGHREAGHLGGTCDVELRLRVVDSETEVAADIDVVGAVDSPACEVEYLFLDI